MAQSASPILEVQHVSKRYAGIRALEDVHFTLLPGEVHALVGENGAGKSTLINVIGGVVPPDEGTISYRGRPVTFRSPAEATAQGIAIIHQDLPAMPSLSVMENMFMGGMPTRWGLVNWRQMERQARQRLQQIGLDLDPRLPMRDLSISQSQLVEIAKSLSFGSQVIIMDEPNSSLTGYESERLFTVIEQLKSAGVAIIYVSHRLDDVLRVSDRLTVLRDGRYIGTLERAEASRDKIITMMVGRELVYAPVGEPAAISETLLEVQGLTRGRLVKDVSFSVRKGEIVGLAGLVGAGRSETARLIFGADRRERGQVLLDSRPINFRSPQDAVAAGIAMVPEDRKRLALFMDLPIQHNIGIAQYSTKPGLQAILSQQERQLTARFQERLSIHMSNARAPVRSLSGGNQQKTILARWLATNPRLLILDEPTHGVDVGAKAEIHRIIRALANEGMGILFISSELPEVLLLSDRIVVMHEGQVTGILDRAEATEDRVMQYATGNRD